MFWAVLAIYIVSGAIASFVAYKKGYKDGYKRGAYGTIDLC